MFQFLRCRFFSFILLLLVSIFNIHSKPADADIINDGLTDIYNLKFDDASKKFKDLQNSNPSDIKGFFYESLIYFYKAITSMEDQDYEKFLSISSDVIDRSNVLLKQNDKNYDAIFYKGLSYSYRSLLMLKLNKSLLRAASNGNDGYRLLNNLIKNKPDYYDAYMGLGLYKIAIGYVPEKFQWLLSIIGFDGNIKDGRNMLQTSMERGKYTKIESKVFLTIFSLKEREEEDYSALNLAKELTIEYPLSPVFKVFYAALSLQAGFIDVAIKSAGDALNLNTHSMQKEVRKAATATLGSAYFRLNDFQKAIPYFEEYLTLTNEDDKYNVYLFTLATAYEMNGNREAALQRYRNVRNKFIDEKDGEDEKYFYRLAQERLKYPMSGFERKLLTGLNLREARKFKEANEIYFEMINSNIARNDDEKIMLFMDLAYSLIMENDIQNAINFLNQSITLKPNHEKWLIPHAYFELGKIYSRQNDQRKANEMFDNIFKNGDYEFRQFLEMRLANYKNKN